MPRTSAGVLAFRRRGDSVEVLLAHPGGPFWVRRDLGAWSIPKGEYTDEPPREAAIREFAEEVGVVIDPDELIDLGEIRQSGGKVVTAFGAERDLDPAAVVSNTFEMEWPRGSGVLRSFPEIDRVEWFDLDTAQHKLLSGQRPLLGRLSRLLGLEPVTDET